MYYTHTFAMDVVFDSDLSDVSEIDLDQSGPIQPYMFEPTRKRPRRARRTMNLRYTTLIATQKSDQRLRHGNKNWS